MSFCRINHSHRERAQIWITASIVLLFSLFRLLVEVRPEVDHFFAAYTQFPVAVFTLNAVFLWLLFLMWLAYRRWREVILSEQELERVLMSISPDALVVINRERVITMCSGQVNTMFGFDAKTLIGQKTDVLYYDRRLHGEKGEIASRLAEYGFHVGYATGKRIDGSTFPLEVITGTIRFQQGAVILMRDITERRRIEDALRQSETRFEEFMRYFPGFAFIKDRDGRRVYLNEAHARERGWDIKACLGCRDEDLYRQDLARQYRETDERVLREGKVMRYVTRTAEEDGRQTSLFTVKFPLPVPGEHGTELMVGGLSLDISEQEAAERERLKIERQMQQAQKLESLGVLAGGIAHDFNNLLMGISGHADLALASKNTEDVHRHIESVVSTCQRAAELANQLLAYSGKGRFVLEPVNVSELVGDLSGLLKVSISKKATLSFDLATMLPPVECDVTQVRQILMNLLVNASDALEDRAGAISIQTGRAALPMGVSVQSGNVYPRVAEIHGGDYVFMRVKDTGIGMTDDVRAKIFDPFFTTKKAGHGLGLAAVLGIVRSHNGVIQIESESGKGSVFTVYFPVSENLQAVPSSKPTGAVKQWKGSGLVLVADDEEMVREVAVMMLKSIGFEVVVAADGQQVLDMYEKHGDAITAMVLDANMPEYGGGDICKILRTRDVMVPIVISSGYNHHDQDEHVQIGNRVYFLKKPYRLDGLRTIMHSVFTEAS